MSNDLHHLAAAYSLDALDDAERHQFEQHYPTCEICSAELEDFREVAGLLAAGSEVEPPADLRNRVLSDISETRQLAPVAPVRTLEPRPVLQRPLLIAAAALLVAALGIVAFSALRDQDSGTDEIVSAPDAVVTNLRLTPDGEAGVLQVVWSDELDRVAVIGSDLPETDPGFTYALWFLLDDGVAPAGLFQPDNGSVHRILDVDDLDTMGWGITVEPVEGSEQPTSPVVFAGTF